MQGFAGDDSALILNDGRKNEFDEHGRLEKSQVKYTLPQIVGIFPVAGYLEDKDYILGGSQSRPVGQVIKDSDRLVEDRYYRYTFDFEGRVVQRVAKANTHTINHDGCSRSGSS